MDLKNYLVALKDFTYKPPQIDSSTRGDYPVRFGGNNLFPQECLLLANESPLQKAILENKVTYMWGLGFDTYTENIYTPNLTESWDDFGKKCMIDFGFFETFYVQIIPNEYGNQYSFYHQPYDQVRLGNYNAENKIEYAYICTDWTKANLNTNVVKIKMWGCETPKKGEKYLMQFKPYQPGNLYYNIPSWVSNANWIMADIALSKFYCNYISNNFTANTVIRYPSEIEEDKKDILYKAIEANFRGVQNAGSVMLFFGENGVLPEISSLSPSDADIYDQYCDKVLQYIISANRLTSPVLAGIQTKSGFSSKADEILAAYALYMNTVIYSQRAFVIDKLNFLLQLNGYKRCLNIVDVNLAAELKGETIENEDKEEDVLDIEGAGTEAEQAEKEAENEEVIKDSEEIIDENK